MVSIALLFRKRVVSTHIGNVLHLNAVCFLQSRQSVAEGSVLLCNQKSMVKDEKVNGVEILWLQNQLVVCAAFFSAGEKVKKKHC